MKLIIDINENVYTRLFDNGRPMDIADGIVIDRAIRNGTPIPDNATNGDVIQMMFPYAEYNTYVDVVDRIAMADKDFEIHFDEDWWNASYKRS